MAIQSRQPVALVFVIAATLDPSRGAVTRQCGYTLQALRSNLCTTSLGFERHFWQRSRLGIGSLSAFAMPWKRRCWVNRAYLVDPW